VREVAITTGDELVGLVALVSTPDRAGLAYATEVLYLAAAAAQARIAIEDARHEVEEGLRDTFLEELRSQVPLSRGHITRRAVRLGCDITHGAVALCAHGDPERPRRMMATIASVVPAALTQAFDGCIYAVLPAVDADDRAEATLALAESVAARLRSYGPVGVSSFYADPAELRSALDEAELMADFLQGPGTPPADVVGRGSYRLLLRLYVSHPEDVWIFYDSTLAPLVGYDDQYGTELVATLESYLGHDCNMNATAAAVFAHRHTIAYRLERVRELTGLDPGRCEDRERLGLGLKAYRILIPRAHLRGSVGPAEPAGN
jgi:sugar diacid utilization regulator